MDQWWEILLLAFGSVLVFLFFLYGINWLYRDDEEKSGLLDRSALLQLLADVTAEAHAQGTEAQRAIEELREVAPSLEAEDWTLFEERYRETLESFSAGKPEVDAQLEHLERIFRRDRIIGQARRELRDQ
ncbi:hypothetical protein [Nesterenkonia haasae]|uniref:hypothetical protein n=1 Tax=Nesterenkonia haasae TaxID=2587813 RepID=UPI001390B0D6|nr:hypothetical protein [Nesterenkonia haasae]NDK31677.1 hypothetical protein [Nesterenkonia haasae]